jgi:large subunit ribosomal protein L10
MRPDHEGGWMPKPEKAAKVKELTERLRSSSGAMFADFRGLSVHDSTELRRSLRGAAASFAVTKNTLTRLAVREAGMQDAEALLEGPTAIAFLTGDAVIGAKVVLDLTKRFPALVVKGAFIDGRVLGAEDARSLATLETREVSLAKVAGILQAPLARIAYLLQAPLQRIAFALAERARQGGVTEAAAEGAPEAAPEAAATAEPEPQAPPEAAATAEPEPEAALAEAEASTQTTAGEEPNAEATRDEPTNAPADEEPASTDENE